MTEQTKKKRHTARRLTKQPRLNISLTDAEREMLERTAERVQLPLSRVIGALIREFSNLLK